MMVDPKEDGAIRVCRYIKRILFLSCRYPAFSSQFIRAQIDKPQTAPEELQEYEDNCASSKRVRAAFLVLLFLSYSFKNLFMVHQSFQVFDYDNLTNNLNELHHSEEQLKRMGYQLPKPTLRSISCLVTNCSRLSRPADETAYAATSAANLLEPSLQLADDVAKLPLLTICRPLVDSFYTPVTKLDAFGILAFLASMYTVFLLGAWMTIFQVISPASDGIIMFIVAPRITASIVRQRAKEIMHDVNVSQRNYRIHFICKYAQENLLRMRSRRAIASEPPARPPDSSHSSDCPNCPNCKPSGLSPIFAPVGHQRNDADEGAASAAAAAAAHKSTPEAPSVELDLEPASPHARLPGSCGGPSPTQDQGAEIRRPSCRMGSLSGAPLFGPTQNADCALGLLQRKWSEWSLGCGDGRQLKDGLYQLVEWIASTSGCGERSGQECERAIDNCMPLVRTDWWRPHSAIIFIKTLIFSLGIISGIGLFSFAYIQYRIILKRTVLDQFGNETARANCFIWLRETDSFHEERAVRLAELHLDWTFYSFLETAGFNIVAGFVIAFMYTYYWVIICEASIWLSEFRMFLVASLIVTRFNYEHERRQIIEHDQEEELVVESGGEDCDVATWYHDEEQAAKTGAKLGVAEQGAVVGTIAGSMSRYRAYERNHFIRVRQFYNVPNLRRQFERSIFLIEILLAKRFELSEKWAFVNENAKRPLSGCYEYRLLNSEDNDHRYAERFLSQILRPVELDDEARPGQMKQQLDELDYDFETMEQIYVNFRLLVEYIHNLRPSMRVVVAITYLLNYGYVLLAVLCRREFINFIQEPLFIIVFAFAIANYLIVLGANFHANAKKLHPLLWSLIAQLTLSKGLRAKHLRSLWLKQVLILDNEGGLAFNTFGIRITYVHIIQLLIWTATIFAIALKPHGQEG